MITHFTFKGSTCDCIRKLSGLLLLLNCLFFNDFVVAGTPECHLSKPEAAATKDAMKRLNHLKDQTLEAINNGVAETTFKAGICKSPDSDHQSDLVLQYDKDQKFITSYGKFTTETIATSGNNFILLSYRSDEMCPVNSTYTRAAAIMFVCDFTQELGKMQVLEEIEKDCVYLFQVPTHYACTTAEGLSGGSIFCILFFTTICVYLLLGFLYQRLVVGAKGLEQIPNYTFWRDFGNLQADGCEFLCRCGPRQEAHSYRGIDERLPRDDERDDQLLNM